MKHPKEQGWHRRLATYVWRHRVFLVLAVAGAVAGSAMQTVVPLVARHIVDWVIAAHHGSMWPWLVLLLSAATLAFVAAHLRRWLGGAVALRVQTDLRNAMHDHLLTLDQDTLGSMSTGQLVARASSDSALVQALMMMLPMVASNVLLMLFSLVVMVVLAPTLALVAVVVLPLLFVVSYLLRTSVFPASWDAQQREGDVAQIVDEAVNGVRVVKAFGQERRELQRVVDAAESLYGARMRAVRLQARFQPLMETLPILAQVAILGLGGWMALHGDLTIGTFLAFSTYIAQFAAPARMLAGFLTVAQQARAGVERIFQLLDTEASITDAADAHDLEHVRGDVELRDVSLALGRSDRKILDGLSLHVAPGERVALIGASGTGKSTVAGLLSRFHDPDSGAVLVDGHDVRHLRLASLRRHVGVAFEDSFLFSDSVRANIAFARPTATGEEVEAAARAAQAHDFIEALPDGYDTAVGERGLSLSGGQRQRIALARAILADPAVLVLDDATSAVDARTEELIHDALRTVLHGRTTLLIAHRLSTLRLADRIALIADGRIAEQGTHEELWATSTAYRALLSGLEEDAEDSIEALAAADAAGVTASAWRAEHAAEAKATRTVGVGAPGLGAGLGGGGGRAAGGAWRLGLAATPELLERVEKLPPVRDEVSVDVEREARPMTRTGLGALLSEFRRPLLTGLALVVLDAVLGLAGPMLVRRGIDDGVATGARDVLLAVMLAFLGVAVVSWVNGVAKTFVTGRTAERVMLSLRVRVWAQLQRLSLDYYEREMAGRIMTRMTTDVDQFESLIENGLLNALVAIATFVGVSVTLLVVNPLLAVCTLSVIVPLTFATIVFRRRSGRLYDLARDRIAIVNADFQESLSGIREAQAFVHETETRERFHRLGQDYLDARVAAQRLIATYFPFVQFLSSVADVIVLGVGAHLITSGHLTAGLLIAFLLYVNMFFSPIQQLSQVFDAWQQTRVSVRRIGDLMALTTLTPDPDDPVEIGRLGGGFALDDVHFRYPAPVARGGVEDRGPADAGTTHQEVVRTRPPEALKGIDLTIAPGETVALVGETGAGKSTAMKLVARFYDPDSGAVRADGHDLRTVALGDFRAQLGYVPQESFLFSGTIRDNIAYGRPSAGDAEVEAAARAVGAHDFIAALPGGYLHEVSERGRGLSAGQRQLIALARAELVDPAILLLDEATANLDLITEARVAAAMQQLTSRRTTIVIAHRLQTARSADRIVVLDHGTVAEVGSHDELLAREGRYTRMWRSFEVSAS